MKYVKVLKDEERKEIMDFMESNLHKTNAEVGTFFYDIKNRKLFLVDSMPIQDAPKFGLTDRRTTRKLHPDVWNDNDMPGDYMQTPRGRVFYNANDNSFDIMTGKWANEYPELLNQIKKRFHLENENVQLKYDEHWDIGNGFGE